MTGNEANYAHNTIAGQDRILKFSTRGTFAVSVMNDPVFSGPVCEFASHPRTSDAMPAKAGPVLIWPVNACTTASIMLGNHRPTSVCPRPTLFE